MQLPASVAAGWLVPPGTTVSGLSGSAWNGEAASVTTPALRLTNVRWSLKPWKLLLLKAGARVNARLPDGALQADINQGLFGRRGSVDDLKGVLPLEQVGELLALPVALTGKAGLQLEHVAWKNGAVVAAQGEIQFARVTEQLSNTELGSFSLVFAPTDEHDVHGVMSDTEAVFKLNGNVILSDDKSWRVEASIQPTNTTPGTITQAVGMLGAQRDNQGHYVLTSTGSYATPE
ncbi:MAG: type II secretion system protein N [Pseudomonadota bacterium]